MSKLADIVDLDLLARMVADRFINTQKFDGLTIWNYAQRAQYDGEWNDATTLCRGLITDEQGNVVARPFRKFFNLGQLDSMPDGPFTASEKMDGSLGIIYRHPDHGIRVATRGSFSSDQALWATDWLHCHSDLLNDVDDILIAGCTPLVEIIYPANRIVVDYMGRESLVLLTCIDRATGDDVAWEWRGEMAASYDGMDLAAVMAMEAPNTEGFVLRWPCGTRAKVKFDEYLRLHKLLTGVNARTIWELLSSGQSLAEVLEVVPDEFYRWVTATAAELEDAASAVLLEAQRAVSSMPLGLSRRDQAEHIKACKYPGVAFALLDGKDPEGKAWRIVKPQASPPFMDGDA